MLNGLYVGKNNQLYTILTPNGIQIAQVFMGADNQLTEDIKTLDVITKAMAKRWGIKTGKN